MKLWKLLTPAVLVCGFVPAEGAVIQTFTSRASWEAAVISFTVENLSTAPLGPIPVGTTALGVVDLTYTEATSQPPRVLQPVPGLRSLEATVGIDAPGFPALPSSVTITLPQPATAFGAFFNSSTSAARVAITIDGAVIELVTYLPPPGNGFFGFISDVPFQDLVFSAPTASATPPENRGEIFSMFDLEFNQYTSPVPEPASVTLFSFGGLLLILAGRRRKIGISKLSS